MSLLIFLPFYIYIIRKKQIRIKKKYFYVIYEIKLLEFFEKQLIIKKTDINDIY